MQFLPLSDGQVEGGEVVISRSLPLWGLESRSFVAVVVSCAV